MPAEPLVIYSWKPDPLGAISLLRHISPILTITPPTGPDENWSSATVTLATGYLRKKVSMTFSHDPAYYTRPDWPQQLRGMQLFYAQYPLGKNLEKVMNTIACFRFAISVFPPPRPDFDITKSTDDRRAILLELTRHLDGIILSPTLLRDAYGQILAGPTGTDPKARFPKLPRGEIPSWNSV